MWFGILTPGEHECRPVARPGVATLYCWNDIARMRIDGPADDVAFGLGMMRRSLRDRGQEPHDPRCFVCGMPYPIPDPEVARSEAQDLPATEDDAIDDAADDEDARAAFDHRPGAAMFALVHLADDIADVRDEEALLVVSGARLAALVPLDAVGRVLELLAVAFAGREPERCACCEAIAPAGTQGPGGMGRAQRRAAARAQRKATRGCGPHRRAA